MNAGARCVQRVCGPETATRSPTPAAHRHPRDSSSPMRALRMLCFAAGLPDPCRVAAHGPHGAETSAGGKARMCHSTRLADRPSAARTGAAAVLAARMLGSALLCRDGRVPCMVARPGSALRRLSLSATREPARKIPTAPSTRWKRTAGATSAVRVPSVHTSAPVSRLPHQRPPPPRAFDSQSTNGDPRSRRRPPPAR